MIDAIDTLNAQFQDLGDTLAGVDLGAVEDAGWALLFTIERLDRRLPVLPDTNPDFTSAGNAQELAGMARRRIDAMDQHLQQHRTALAALGNLLGAIEDAFRAGQDADTLIREIDHQILILEGVPQ